MLVVPLKGDTIVTKDGGRFKVLSYTNFKTKGPGVYVDHGFKRSKLVIYFFDIEKINGVKVEYNTSMKIFKAFGIVKRKIHLPQENDTIVAEVKFDGELHKIENKVKKLKLHQRGMLGYGLLIYVEDRDDPIRLKNIVDIDRAISESSFDRDKFLSIYEEYMGH